jgi:hypothetical protein
VCHLSGAYTAVGARGESGRDVMPNIYLCLGIFKGQEVKEEKKRCFKAIFVKVFILIFADLRQHEQEGYEIFTWSQFFAIKCSREGGDKTLSRETSGLRIS